MMIGEPIVILMVEDNMDHAELILRCFEEHHFANKVFHVTDGEAALNYLYEKKRLKTERFILCPV